MHDNTLFQDEGLPAKAYPVSVLKKINTVRRKIAYIKRDADLEVGGGRKVRVATHDYVVAMIRPHMIDAGLIVTQTLVKSIAQPFERIDEKTRAKMFRYEATYEITLIDVDTGAALSVFVESHAMDNADKAPGKAASYAMKTALLKTFMIETGESDESSNPESELGEWVAGFAKTKTIEELQSYYGVAFAFAKPIGPDAVREIVSAKDARKKELLTELGVGNG